MPVLPHHRHMPDRDLNTRPEPRPFLGPAIPAGSPGHEPRAHGNVSYVEQCACGAIRITNINQLWTEFGPWHLPETS